MITAVEYIGGVGVGVTSPQIFRGDDGHVYIVKLQNNRLGTKVLVNEFLACRFSQILDLCFPEGGLINIEDVFIHKNKRLRAARVQSGWHFASRYLSGVEYVGRRNMAKAANKKQMAGVMLFDHMFHNVDRTWNRKNLLLRREASVYRLYAIDNSHLFRRGRWSEATLTNLVNKIGVNKRRSFGWLLKYYLAREDFSVYVDRVKGITDIELQRLVEDIPMEWLPDMTERAALLMFMQKRRDMVEQIVEPLYRLIPDVNRRTYTDKVE